MIELAGYALGYAVGLYLIYRYVAKPGVGRVRSLVGGIRD